MCEIESTRHDSISEAFVRSEIALRPPQTGFKRAQDHPRAFATTPRRLQDRPKRPQDTPKTTPRPPKDYLKRAQECPRGPKTAPRPHPKTDQDRPKITQDRCKTSPEAQIIVQNVVPETLLGAALHTHRAFQINCVEPFYDLGSSCCTLPFGNPGELRN